MCFNRSYFGASVVQENFNNVCILFLECTRRRGTQTGSPCTNLAIYSLEFPNDEQSGQPGRPKFEINEDVLIELRLYGFTWKQIADMFLVSRWTIRRHVVEYVLQEATRFSELSDERIDFYVKQFIELRLQHHRVRASMSQVDLRNSRIIWAIVVSR